MRLIVIILLLWGCKEIAHEKEKPASVTGIEKATDTTYGFKANPQKGFNYGYLIYIPEKLNFEKTHTLLVESSNTGANDSIEHHYKRALIDVSLNSIGSNISKVLKTPFLMPIFPRPKTEWKYYTHALDRDTFLEEDKMFSNINLQLLAMVEDAKKKLIQLGVKIDDKFLITGFSASGTFANRFALLHANKLKAVAAGGINGLLIVPETEIDNTVLNFPVGITDVEKGRRSSVNVAAFKELPQFYFMGVKDTNDAVEYNDGYSERERKTVHSVLGKKMMPERWQRVQGLYRKNGINAHFKTYKDIGHEYNLKVLTDISDFFHLYSN